MILDSERMVFLFSCSDEGNSLDHEGTRTFHHFVMYLEYQRCGELLVNKPQNKISC